MRTVFVYTVPFSYRLASICISVTLLWNHKNRWTVFSSKLFISNVICYVYPWIKYFLEFMRILEGKSSVICSFLYVSLYISAFVWYFRQITKRVVQSSRSTGLFLCGLAKLSVSGLFVVALRSRWLVDWLE